MFPKENGWIIRTYNCQNWQKLKLIYHEFWIADFGKWQKCCRSLWRSPQLFHKYENSQFSYEKDNNFDIFWYDNCRWSTENRITSLLHTMLSKDWDMPYRLAIVPSISLHTMLSKDWDSYFITIRKFFRCCIPCLVSIETVYVHIPFLSYSLHTMLSKDWDHYR